MHSILIAEDDAAIAELMDMTMQLAGYRATQAPDGYAALEQIEGGKHDLAILDIMLPGIDGHALLEAAKKRGLPAIFVTAKTSVADRVGGLRLGADDYLTKPFDPLELLARVENVLRRAPKSADASTEILRAFDLEMDLGRHAVSKDNENISLTPREFDLLELFLRHPNRIFSREQLLDRVWGYDYYGNTRTVDMHVQKLRAKLGLETAIVTVHKVGYRLETGL